MSYKTSFSQITDNMVFNLCYDIILYRPFNLFDLFLLRLKADQYSFAFTVAIADSSTGMERNDMHL